MQVITLSSTAFIVKFSVPKGVTTNNLVEILSGEYTFNLH